jgi:hypothetical protein
MFSAVFLAEEVAGVGYAVRETRTVVAHTHS